MDKTLAFQNVDTLRAIKAQPGIANAELARTLERDPSNLRRTLGLLVDEGLIVRDPLSVTEAGQAILAADDVAEGRTAAPGQADAVPGQLALRHDQIQPNPDNDRRDWDSEDAVADLDALAGDIADNGLLQNLVVRQILAPNGLDLAHVLVGGERRWRAIGRLMERGDWPADRPIPCRLFSADDLGVRLAALAENLQRRDLNPIEEANAYRGLRDAGLTTDQIAEKVRLTQRHIQMRLQLLEHLDEDQQRRMTLPADDPKRLSVSEARKLVQAAEGKRKAREEAEAKFTPRQRLILAEMCSRNGGYIYGRVEVDGDAMNADEDAVALDKAGMLFIPTTLDHEGRAQARLDAAAWAVTQALFADDPGAYAVRMREALGLPAPEGEGQGSITWMNGPFEVPAEIQEQIAAERAATDARNKAEAEARAAERKARMEREAMTRVHAEGLFARAAVAPSAPLLDDMQTVATQLEHPLPWRVTDNAEVIDAEGEQVMRFGNYYGEADDADMSLAMLTVAAVNAAAGLETPPVVVAVDDGDDQDSEGEGVPADADEGDD